MYNRTLVLSLFLSLFASSYADYVSVDRASGIANRMIGSAAVGETVKTIVPRSELGTRASEDANYYIFTGADNKGFVIVSADDAVRPVLGYSPDCPIDADNLPANILEYLHWVDQQVSEAKAMGQEADADVKSMWQAQDEITPVVLLETANWSQEYPYNADCPKVDGTRTMTGCVATAAAILMRYYSYPEHGFSATREYKGADGVIVSSRNLETHRYDWANMPLEHQTQTESMAELMADIGAAMKLNYGIHSTGGHLYVDNMTRYFGYVIDPNVSHSGNIEVRLRKSLDRKRPVLLSGNDGIGPGHEFIADGYSDNGMFHINWGWKGHANGYFYLNALTPAGQDFTKSLEAVTDCIPETMLKYPVECDGKYYTTISDAVKSKNYDDHITVTLQGDLAGFVIDFSSTYFYHDITIDLNGHTLETDGILVYNKMSVIDTQGTGKIVSNYTNYVFVVHNGGELTMEGINCRVDKNDSEMWYSVVAGDGGKVTLKDCMIESYCLAPVANTGGELLLSNCVLINHGVSNRRGSEVNGIYCDREGIMTEVTDCQIKVSSPIGAITANSSIKLNNTIVENEGDGNALLFHQYYSNDKINVEITGGAFMTKGSNTLVSLSKCDLTIHAGSFLASDDKPLLQCKSDSHVKIGNGSFYGKLCELDWSSSLSTSGGIYSQDPSAYVPMNCSVAENNNFATKADYPFMIVNPDGISSLTLTAVPGQQFDLLGRPVNGRASGIVIERMGNGRAQKRVVNYSIDQK